MRHWQSSSMHNDDSPCNLPWQRSLWYRTWIILNFHQGYKTVLSTKVNIFPLQLICPFIKYLEDVILFSISEHCVFWNNHKFWGETFNIKGQLSRQFDLENSSISHRQIGMSSFELHAAIVILLVQIKWDLGEIVSASIFKARLMH